MQKGTFTTSTLASKSILLSPIPRVLEPSQTRPLTPLSRSCYSFHVWGHAALSFVAFGTLSLFSASVSQCLFPGVRPWVFVFTQIILLVICCFIAMFWIDDPTLSIGLMVVPQTDVHSTQTPNGNVNPTTGPITTSAAFSSSNGLGVGASGAAATYNASTSTTALHTAAFLSPNLTSGNNMTLALSQDHPSPTSMGLANVALANTVMNSAMSMSSPSAMSSTTVVNSGPGIGGGGGMGGGGGLSRMSSVTKSTPTMSSVHEKQRWDHDRDNDNNIVEEVYEEKDTAISGSAPSSTERVVEKEESNQHFSLKME
ncbi:hypothetical protein BC939DRAFT_451214 [Gamsiella multidivaricata]|uniref:uncharacterized protein n=1 Tax=Gamsiella multidivaricata TaxID=101098 RepID=UPI00221EF6F7|nr:uncharacterized protein BC939DRAFT_451214 [Gamsiella multidivaricata]KAI7823511.1 hypothetical protein BC939DRAFT_451214 [Gamsiella multidivaricata]